MAAVSVRKRSDVETLARWPDRGNLPGRCHGIDVHEVYVRSTDQREGECNRARQLKSRHALPFFHKQPPCLAGIEACASSHRRGGADVRQGHGYVDQQHHDPNQQYKGEQTPAEAREGFYDEMLELRWKFHRCVPRSYGDGRDHSQAVAMPSVASASKPRTGRY
jgi:hypothetical protein